MSRLLKRAVPLLLVLTVAFSCLAISGCGDEKENYPREYSEYVTKYAKEYGVEEAFVYAVIKQESNFDPQATSSAGAIGLMQMMPDTITWVLYYNNDNSGLTSDSFYDPETNIHYGTFILKYLLDMYGDMGTAIAAYNAGWGNVNEWLANSEYSDDGKTLKSIPFPETEAYVQIVTDNYNKYKELYYS